MALANYTDLKASVADFLNRSDLTSVIPDFVTMAEAEFNRTLRVREMSVRTQGQIDDQYVKLPDDFLGMRNIELMTDLTSVIPDFVTLAEAEFNRTLRVREMSVRTQGQIDDQYVKLPDDFLGMRNIELMTDPVTPLEYKNLQNLDIHRRNDKTGKPLYYSIVQNNIEFAPVPSETYTLEIVYYQKIPTLAALSGSGTGATNWLLDNHPDAYLYGTLQHSAPYLHDDERVGIWAGKYQQVIEQITTSDEKAKFSGSTPSISFTPF